MSIDAALLDRTTRDLRKVESERAALLEVLKEVESHLVDLSRPLSVRADDAYCAAHSAIAKAEGR